jgi:hypothetical protein
MPNFASLAVGVSLLTYDIAEIDGRLEDRVTAYLGIDSSDFDAYQVHGVTRSNTVAICPDDADGSIDSGHRAIRHDATQGDEVPLGRMYASD